MAPKEVDHWKQLATFARYEILAGGPDPHMRLVGHMSRGCSWEERVWRAGCYIGVYNVPSAEAIWQSWPWSRVREEPNLLGSWLREHWAGIALRRERKKPLTNSPEKLAQFLRDYAFWASYGLEAETFSKGKELYEIIWEDARKQVKYLGRYSCFKLLEFLTRYCEIPMEMPDIRPIGGDFPRRTLDVLYPEYRGGLGKGNDPETLRFVAQAVNGAIERLAREENLELGYYTFEVMLCDYRQSWEGKRQYPGRSQDSELDYRKAISDHWGEGDRTEMFAVRREIFPHWALGEIQGWSGVRKELGHVLREQGYTWSDSLFDYARTTDLSQPISK